MAREASVRPTAEIQLQAPARAQRGRAIVSCNFALDGPSESALFGLPNTTNNGFDVVTVTIDEVGGVVIGRVLPRTGRSVAFEPRLDPDAMKCLHRGLRLRDKRTVKWFRCLPVDEGKRAKLRRLSAGLRIAERGEYETVEGDACAATSLTGRSTWSNIHRS